MKSITERNWKNPLPFIVAEQDQVLTKEFGIAPEIIKILANRGITESGAIRRFLFPTLHDLTDPSSLLGLNEASEIIAETIAGGGEILIWGDYDVDGVTATSLLVRFFQDITEKTSWFIPNRYIHGYGLNKTKLFELLSGSKTLRPLLITVDCGINSNEEVEMARSMGWTVIVTDHHEPSQNMAKADVIINPKQHNCPFPDKDIAGVGIAFYLAIGIRSFLKQSGFYNGPKQEPNLKQLLDLVAIGTIADMVALRDSNRVLVKAGFEVLNSKPSPGIAALLHECDVFSSNITSEDIAFHVAPKINAAGRLAEASLAVELFLEEDPLICRKRAKKLSLLNNKRKEACRLCLESTLDILDISAVERDGCLIERVDHSIGILGIVASQILEKLRVPVIFVAENQDPIHGTVLKGSCRSLNNINIFDLLELCQDDLLQYGGHALAAGVTLLPERLESFKQSFIRHLRHIEDVEKKPGCIDLEVEVEKALSSQMVSQLQLLEPFGMHNEKPIFLDKKIIPQEIRRIGKNGDHITFVKRGKYENKKCVAFRFGEHEQLLKNQPTCDVIYTISLSRFKKAEQWQAHLIDII